PSVRPGLLFSRTRWDRQPDGERRSPSRPFAVPLDRSAMELDEALDDGEAETEPLARSRLAVLLLAEGGEEEALEFGRKPAAVIADREFDASLGLLELHLDVPALGGELHRVREQLAHDLPESDGIGAGPWRVMQ